MLFNSSDYDRAHLIGYDKGHSDGYENGYADAYHETKSEYEEDIAELEKEVDRLIEAAEEVGAELEEVQRARSGDISRMFGKYSEGYTDGYTAALKLDCAAIKKTNEDLKKSLSTTRWENADLKKELKILRADFERIKDIDIAPEEYVKALLKYNAKEEFNKGFQQGKRESKSQAYKEYWEGLNNGWTRQQVTIDALRNENDVLKGKESVLKSDIENCKQDSKRYHQAHKAEVALKERLIENLYEENKKEFNRGLRQGEWKREYKYSSEKYGM